MQTDHIKKRLAKNEHSPYAAEEGSWENQKDFTRNRWKGQLGHGKQNEEVWLGKWKDSIKVLIILICYKRHIKSFIETVAEPKKTRTEVLQCAISRRAFFLTSYCSIQLAGSFHPRESLYCSIQSSLSSERRSHPPFLVGGSRRKRARARPPPP